MKIRTAQYITKKQNGSYTVSAYRYQESLGDRSFQKGDLYCLLSIESEEDIQATTLSKFVWDGILDSYMYSEAKTPNEAIMEALKMGEKKVRDLIKNDKSLEESGVNLNFALIANKKDGFYIGVYGDMEVFVYREGSFVCISEVLKKNNAKTAGVILRKDEFLALSTPELFSAFVDSFDSNAGVDAIENSLKSIENSLEGLEGIFTLRVEDDTREEVSDENVNDSGDMETKESSLNQQDIEEERKAIVLNGGMNKYVAKLLDIWISVKAFFVEKYKQILDKISDLVSPVRKKTGELLSNKKTFKKVEAKLSEIKFSRPKKNLQGFRIDGYKSRNIKQKRIKIVVLGFLCIVGISLLAKYIVDKKKENEIHNTATEQMDEAEKYLEDASNNVVKDKDSAEVSLYKANEILNSVSKEISEEDSKRKESLSSEYLNLEDTLLNRIPVSESNSTITEYLNTRLAFGENSSPSDIVLYTDDSGNNYLYISDEGNKAVYRVSLYDKSVSKVPDTSSLLKSPEYIDYGNNGVYVYDSVQGVLYAPFSDSFNSDFKTLTGVKNNDLDDDSISEMAILTSTDNIYLLSRDKKAIIKSTNTGSGYGLTYSYIKSDTFAQASDFFSDFTIYVLRPGSDGLETYVYSYVTSQYSLSNVSLSGLEVTLDNLTKGYTTGDLGFGLYVFDATKKIFARFEKPQESEDLHPGEEVLKGLYLYRGEKKDVFSDVKDFVVDPTETYMYVLDGKTVWKVTL